jgi:hypothetical protein
LSIRRRRWRLSICGASTRHNHAAQPQAGVAAIENVGPFFDKRTGPIVAIAAGSLSESDAQTLLGAVNWKPSVTWNENTYFDKKDNIANLLVNIIHSCASSWVRYRWRLESLSAALGFSCGAISPAQFSAAPTRPSSFLFTWLRRLPRVLPAALEGPQRPPTGLKCLRNIGLGPFCGLFVSNWNNSGTC